MLRWDDATQRYSCGALGPEAAAGRTSGKLAALRKRLVARWIGAGIGCDSRLAAQRLA
jgi:hypothetical protein